jgi:hypothetical protein
VCLATTPGFQLDTDEGGSFLPGFVEALIGIQNGETRSFDLVFPEAWEQESLRGLKARFTVNTKSLSTPSSEMNIRIVLIQSAYFEVCLGFHRLKARSFSLDSYQSSMTN